MIDKRKPAILKLSSTQVSRLKEIFAEQSKTKLENADLTRIEAQLASRLLPSSDEQDSKEGLDLEFYDRNWQAILSQVDGDERESVAPVIRLKKKEHSHHYIRSFAALLVAAAGVFLFVRQPEDLPPDFVKKSSIQNIGAISCDLKLRGPQGHITMSGYRALVPKGPLYLIGRCQKAGYLHILADWGQGQQRWRNLQITGQAEFAAIMNPDQSTPLDLALDKTSTSLQFFMTRDKIHDEAQLPLEKNLALWSNRFEITQEGP